MCFLNVKSLKTQFFFGGGRGRGWGGTTQKERKKEKQFDVKSSFRSSNRKQNFSIFKRFRIKGEKILIKFRDDFGGGRGRVLLVINPSSGPKEFASETF